MNCEECGDPITAKRLRAMPEATLCLACQTVVDDAMKALDTDGHGTLVIGNHHVTLTPALLREVRPCEVIS